MTKSSRQATDTCRKVRRSSAAVATSREGDHKPTGGANTRQAAPRRPHRLLGEKSLYIEFSAVFGTFLGSHWQGRRQVVLSATSPSPNLPPRASPPPPGS